MTTRVSWPADLRKKVQPRRGFLPQSKRKQRPLDECWNQLRNSFRQWSKGWERGIPHADDDLALIMKRVLEQFGEDARRPERYEMDVASAMVCGVVSQVQSEGDPFVSLWVHAEGLAFAVEAAVRCRLVGIEYVERAGEYTTRARRIVRRTPNDLEWPAKQMIEALRAEVARADHEAYAEARARALSLRESIPLCLRCALSFVFPEEPQWAAFDARALLTGLAAKTSVPWHGQILLASLNDPGLIDQLRTAGTWPWFVWDYALDFVATFGEQAIPTLRTLLEVGLQKRREVGRQRLRGCARALSLIEHPEVASILAPHLATEELRSVASDFMLRVPELARAALPPLLTQRGRLAELAAQLLATIDLSTATPSEQDLEATDAELPRVLVDPSWRRARSRRAPLSVEGVAPLQGEETIVFRTPREQESALVRHAYWTWETMDANAEAKYLESLQNVIATGKTDAIPFAYELVHQQKKMKLLREELRLSLWNESNLRLFQRYSLPSMEMLARHGVAALPGMFHFMELDPGEGFQLLSRVSSPRVAPVMARAYARKKAQRETARTWLLRAPTTTALGAIPMAVGPPGREREAGEAALLLLLSRGHAQTLRVVADRYGAKVSAAVDEILTRDPFDLCPAEPPKLPTIWRPRAWPRPRLLSGAVPSMSAIDRLGEMLQLSPLDPPYAGIAVVRDAFERGSLDAFAWAIFTAWLLAGSPSQHEWMLSSLAHLGDDEVARRLAPFVRDWRIRGERKRAHKGIDLLAALAAHGSDVALLHLGGMAHRGRYEDMRARARSKLDDLADVRGLSPEELADRTVPDLDLDPDGGKQLDFGPRSFRVGFDEHLQPFVQDVSRKRLHSLPRVAKTDDPQKAAAARELWKRLQVDAKALSHAEIRRFEVAMCSRRRWSAASFRAHVVGHPLLVHLARRLVWGVYPDRAPMSAPSSTFRVAEDRSLADADDQIFELPGDAVVGLPHALENETELTQRWAPLFGDYEILQPFDQIGRAVFHPTEAERTANALDRYKGVSVNPGKVMALEYRGWSRAGSQEAGSFQRTLPQGVMVGLSITPGFDPRTLKDAKPQSINMVWLASGSERLTWGTLDAFTFSEVVRDLESIR